MIAVDIYRLIINIINDELVNAFNDNYDSNYLFLFNVA